ncbi:MAG: 50S ribosomal protein L2 [Nanobdellota archaeon]
MGKNIISQRRGKGTTSFRAPSFKYKGEAKVPFFNTETEGIIVDLINCPGHYAPLSVVEYSVGSIGFQIAPEGIIVGKKIYIDTEKVDTGNTLKLKNIPEGTPIYNVESMPGDGGSFGRSSGNTLKVLSRVPEGIVLQMPSKKKRVFNENCRATIGIVASGGRSEKPLLKAGTNHFKKKARNQLYPVVSGASMNALDHPFGNKRSSRKSKARPISRNAPPGRKVGNVAARRTGQKRSRSRKS